MYEIKKKKFPVKTETGIRTVKVMDDGGKSLKKGRRMIGY